MKKREAKGRSLFYTRDSGGRHEMTPGEYVAWASRTAAQLGLSFDGAPEQIEQMIAAGLSVQGDLFQDYGVSGNLLSRPGLDALIKEALADKSVTHIFIPRRDRLARPDNPIDGVKLENLLRTAGITLVFMDRTVQPLAKSRRPDIGELIAALLDYDTSGKFRRDLAQKLIYAQMRLAKLGYSIGGRAPYGFRRFLVKDDGTAVRQLLDGEYVRMAHHHVVWLPGPEVEIAVIRRILMLLETKPASQVASLLTQEGIPAPDAGRTRTDRGIKHPTSGVWHQTTVIGIARNPMVAALVGYGRRSMGDQLRFSPDGPRELEDADRRNDGKPKVVRNPEAAQVLTPARFDPLIPRDRYDRLIDKLNERAGTQRGKPRSVDPSRNPLGCRVYDMNCGWTMYRQPYGESFRYLCGLYQQSQGAKCAHNLLDGLLATRFLLECTKQRILMPGTWANIERHLQELARQEVAGGEQETIVATKKTALAVINAKVERAARNMALAENEEQYKAMASVFEQLKREKATLEAELKTDGAGKSSGNLQSEIAKALELGRRLPELAADSNNLGAVGELFNLLNARLFLRFKQVKAKKRPLNKVTGGVVTWGAAPAPVPIYLGPTSRKVVKDPAGALLPAGSGDFRAPPASEPGPGEGGNSLGNVHRGERI
jgi:DNA invertase Pin-like site-specific DNA recombinase